MRVEAKASRVREVQRARSESTMGARRVMFACSDAQSRLESAAGGIRRSRGNRAGKLFAMMARVRRSTNKRQDHEEKARLVTRKKKYLRSDKEPARPMRLITRERRRKKRRQLRREAGAQGHGDRAIGSYGDSRTRGKKGYEQWGAAEETRSWCTHDVLKGLSGVKKCLWRCG
jgi:hypothetical protein